MQCGHLKISTKALEHNLMQTFDEPPTEMFSNLIFRTDFFKWMSEAKTLLQLYNSWISFSEAIKKLHRIKTLNIV